ncbi:heat-shock protein Hsp20 [Capsulimonas corticalis]|uniref:Heat-shock protein Hsp20 n=1 Tax=Capsulimonas corticalis TaxID=2219043 RepID=A0A402D461_9BACT|nr:Hsp20/alpha crystallin family protein [Capsulimonas corticalis]BDI29666.1 heat-shock protein Hsp20 [Capsulimonas corticalis]
MAFKDYRDIIRQMEREMQQLSDEAFRGFFAVPMGGAGRFWQPPVDIHETEEALLVKMELAGARADDLQVALSSDDRVLTISGARGETHLDREGRVRCHQLEIYFGPFERAIALPTSIPIERDNLKATYRDGFLIITLPKKPTPKEKPQTRVIPISNGDASDAQRENQVQTESEGE